MTGLIAARDAALGWTPRWVPEDDRHAATRGLILVGRKPASWTRAYALWKYIDAYGAYDQIRAETPEQIRFAILVQFNTCVVRDGIDPYLVHIAFLKIKEYSQFIARDQPGARDDGDDAMAQIEQGVAWAEGLVSPHFADRRI